MPAFSKLAVAAVAFTGVMAVPYDSLSKMSTHGTHVTTRNTKFTSYHPEATYETFGKGIEHPLSKRSVPASAEEAALSFLETKLGVARGQLKYRTGYAGQSAEHIYVKQVINGIEVSNGVANVALRNNKIVTYGSNFIKPKTVASATAKITEAQAITAAETQLDGKYNQWPTRKEYFLSQDDTAVLTYIVQIQNDAHWYEAYVDASTTKIVNVIDFVAHASYRVVPFTKQDPTWSGFTLLTDPQDLTASPNGWHQDTASYTVTKGNNVNAYHGSSSTGQAPQSASGLVFDYTWSSTTAPTTTTNLNVAKTNAFYVGNAFHDLLYKYGFTESAYNFQNTNNGKGGTGNDAVNLYVQASGKDNANFATPADGQKPLCNMYLWDLTNPERDGDLSNDVTSLRTESPTGCLTTTEAGGMGEGWSDTVAFWVETNSTTPVDFTLGSWVYNDPAGIRSVPYSTNTARDPYTYATLKTKSEVHDIGEVWATMMIEVYWGLVAAKGYSSAKTDPTGTAGNIVFFHLLIDALPIQPCNPTFLTARNAIIQADVNRYAGANKCTIWTAFAKRGLGVNATTSRTNDYTVPTGC